MEFRLGFHGDDHLIIYVDFFKWLDSKGLAKIKEK